MEFVSNILKNPDYYINNYELGSSSDQSVSKQGYLYLLEKSSFKLNQLDKIFVNRVLF